MQNVLDIIQPITLHSVRLKQFFLSMEANSLDIELCDLIDSCLITSIFSSANHFSSDVHSF